MIRIALYNNKGGVAKSTSVINLAYCFQKAGKKVLVVDCDQQENCFMFFMTAKDSSPILPSDYENIKHTTWTRYIELDACETNQFDYILFDLPPAMTDEVKRIIHHSGIVFVPTLLGEFEVAGLKKVTVEISKQQARLGGIFITMYQKENDAAILTEFQNVLDAQMMRTVIPFSRTVRESLKAGLPIEAYFIDKKVPRSPTSWKIVDAYDNLALEMMERLEKVDTPVTFQPKGVV